MINFFLIVAFNVLQFILSLFSVGAGFPQVVHDAFTTLGGYIGIIDVFVPLSIVGFAVTSVLIIEIALFGFKAIKWFMSFIPLFGGKGNI